MVNINEANNILSQYDKTDHERLEKVKQALEKKNGWDKTIETEDGNKIDIALLLAYEYSIGIENITKGKINFDTALENLMSIDKLILGNFKENDDDILYGKSFEDETMIFANSKEYYDNVRKSTGAMNFTYFDKNGKLSRAVALYKEVRDENGIKIKEGATFKDLADLRDTVFHEVTHTMEQSIVKEGEEQFYTSTDGRKYANFDNVTSFRKMEVVNGERRLSDIIELPKEEQFGISYGMSTKEMAQDGTLIIHNQVTEGFVQATSIAIMRSLGFPEEEIGTTKYFEKVQLAQKVIEARDSALGEGQTFADFNTNSYKVKYELERIQVGEKNGLQYISDYGEDSDRGKTEKSRLQMRFGELSSKLEYGSEKKEEIEESKMLGKLTFTKNEIEMYKKIILNGKTDESLVTLVEDFIVEYQSASLREKDFFDEIPMKLDFSKFKEENSKKFSESAIEYAKKETRIGEMKEEAKILADIEKGNLLEKDKYNEEEIK